MAIEPNAPVYLVELMDPHLATLERVDVTRFLENAVAVVVKHLSEFEFEEPVEVQVTVDSESRELAGIVLFNEEGEPISVIRPYYLNREGSECDDPKIRRAVQATGSKLENKLNRIFKR